jgi:hypothetical protein
MKRFAVLLLLACNYSAQAIQGFYFWTLTDVQFDDSYQFSCRADVTHADITDQPLGHKNCDSPWALVESTVQAMKFMGPHPSFIMFGG